MIATLERWNASLGYKVMAWSLTGLGVTQGAIEMAPYLAQTDVQVSLVGVLGSAGVALLTTRLAHGRKRRKENALEHAYAMIECQKNDNDALNKENARLQQQKEEERKRYHDSMQRNHLLTQENRNLQQSVQYLEQWAPAVEGVQVRATMRGEGEVRPVLHTNRYRFGR